MAIFGKSSIIEHVRSMGFVYWRIYQSAQDKNAGNYVASADFNNPNLGPEASMDALNLSLGRLTAGQYLLSCYEKPGQSKGGINTYIEVESNGSAAVSGIGAVQPASTFFLEGIGAVTPENFESAVEQKMQKMMDQQREKDRVVALEKELVELKKEKRENEGGFQRGIMTIGSVLYGTISKSPAGKEFIGMARDLFFQAKAGERSAAATSEGSVEEAHVIGSVNNDEERLLGAVEKLSKDNPEFLEQIEMLAKLKETDPDTFNQAVDGLKNFSNAG